MTTFVHQRRVIHATEILRQTNPGIRLDALEELLMDEKCGAAVQDVQEIADWVAKLQAAAQKSWWRRLLGM